VVMPLFFYSQADNKDNYRVSITGKLVANMLKKAGVSKVMILDPRTPQLEGFFDAPIDAIKVEPVISHWIKENVENYVDCVVICPDENGIRKVHVVADDLDIDHATVNSRLRNRADISDEARRQLRHNRLNHQHMSDNWQIVETTSDEDEDGIGVEAENIERILRFSESNNASNSASSSSCGADVDSMASSSCNGEDNECASLNINLGPNVGHSHKVSVSRKARKSVTIWPDSPVAAADEAKPLSSAALLRPHSHAPAGVTAFPRACAENEEHQFLETRISGDVKGKICVLIDDVIDTGRGIKAAVEALFREGASGVHVWATHGVFAPEALALVQNFDKDFVKSVTVTNSIPQTMSKQILGDRLQVIDVSGLIAEAIRRHHYCESVAMISYCLNSQPLAKDPSRSDSTVTDPASLSSEAATTSQVKVVEKQPQNNPRNPIERLRKGYRLSSKCWD